MVVGPASSSGLGAESLIVGVTTALGHWFGASASA